MNENRQLMVETIETLWDYTGRVINALGDITGFIQSGREDRAFNMCIDLIDGMKWIYDAIALTVPVQKEFGVVIDTISSIDMFEQLVDAFENKDYVLISDILEYELKPVVSEWNKKLEVLTAATGTKS